MNSSPKADVWPLVHRQRSMNIGWDSWRQSLVQDRETSWSWINSFRRWWIMYPPRCVCSSWESMSISYRPWSYASCSASGLFHQLKLCTKWEADLGVICLVYSFLFLAWGQMCISGVYTRALLGSLDKTSFCLKVKWEIFHIFCGFSFHSSIAPASMDPCTSWKV